MQSPSMFADRVLRLSYWNTDSRVIDADRLQLETSLKRLGDVSVHTVKSLDVVQRDGCDLLIVAAQSVPRKEFAKWLLGFRGRIHSNGKIWVPALILADVGFETLADILADVTSENWYFDILAPSHMDSLPIRVANLLRIHDHLHEISRYETAIAEVSSRVRELERQVQQVKEKADKQ
jgi:hypothetical protein